MKKLVLFVAIMMIGYAAYADFPGSPISGGGGTTNADDLVSGTVAIARGGTASGTAAAARAALGTDNAANIDGTKGGLDNVIIGATTPAAGSFSSLTRGTVSDTEFSYLDGVTSAIQTQINLKANSASPTLTGPDTIPAAFSFTDQTGVALGSTNNSDNVTVTAIDNQTTLVLTGDASCKYSINGGEWATADDNVTLNDNVALQNVASGSYSTAVSCTLNLGGVTDTWSRTTLAPADDPVLPRGTWSAMGGNWN
jgi:hypothetical protein